MKDGYRLIGGVYNKPLSKIKPGELGVIDIGNMLGKHLVGFGSSILKAKI